MGKKEAESIGGVAFEVGSYSVLCIEPFEAVSDTFIVVSDMSPIQKNLLYLQSKFNNFDWGGYGFGDKCSGSSEEEFHEKTFEFGFYLLLGKVHMCFLILYVLQPSQF